MMQNRKNPADWLFGGNILLVCINPVSIIGFTCTSVSYCFTCCLCKTCKWKFKMYRYFFPLWPLKSSKHQLCFLSNGSCWFPLVFIVPAASRSLYNKLGDIIIHYRNYLFTHPVSGRSSFICFVLQHQSEEEHPPPPPPMTRLTAQFCVSNRRGFHWAVKPTWAMFLTPIRSQTAVRGSPGVTSGGPLPGLDGKGNCKPGRPGARAPCVYLAAFTTDVTTL